MRGPKPHRLLQAIPANFQQAPRTGIEPVFAWFRARLSDQQLPPRCAHQHSVRESHPISGLQRPTLRLRAGENCIAPNRAPEAGIESATLRLSFTLPYQYRNHRDFEAPSGSRTHTSAMARQQATATSWAQKLHHYQIVKDQRCQSIKSTEPESNLHHLVTKGVTCRWTISAECVGTQ